MQSKSSLILARTLLTLAWVLLPLGLCSCQNLSGPTNVISQGDRLEVTIKAPISRIGTAARDLMVQQKMTVVAYSITQTNGRIVAYTPTGARMELLIYPVDANSNKVSALTSGAADVTATTTNLLAKIASKAS